MTLSRGDYSATAQVWLLTALGEIAFALLSINN